MGPGVKLRIEVQEVEGAVLIDFIDNGEGIAPDERELMFDKFSRVGTQDGDGAGLGLAICREIMSRLDGDIGYLAEAEGTGFRIVVPRTQALAAQ